MTIPVALGLAAAWAALLVWSVVRMRLPWPLPPQGAGGALVSVVVPARNEAVNIERCLVSLCASSHPAFEVIVVDDQSSDGTGDLARGVDPGTARRVDVLDAPPLPPGWLGKPWACHRGSLAATGELLLFTDADTRHGPDLMERAVRALDEDGADALTVLGKQEMVSFWERVVQPQVFLAMATMFHDTRSPFDRRRWRRSIANGQYLMIRRTAYEALGGHRAVRGEVAEDLRLAQIMVRDGFTLSWRDAGESLTTRMYRSLGQLVEGWTKNVARGARLVSGGAASVALWAGGLVVAPLIWLLPPVFAVAGLTGRVPGPVLLLALLVTSLNVAFWAAVTWRLGAPARYGFLHPLGVAVMWAILFRSLIRGERVEWKGRTYHLDAPP